MVLPLGGGNQTLFFSLAQVWRKAFGSVVWILNASEAVNEVYLERLKRALHFLSCNIWGSHQRVYLMVSTVYSMGMAVRWVGDHTDLVHVQVWSQSPSLAQSAQM